MLTPDSAAESASQIIPYVKYHYSRLDVILVIARLIGLTCNSQKVFWCGIEGSLGGGWGFHGRLESEGACHGLEVRLIIT